MLYLNEQHLSQCLDYSELQLQMEKALCCLSNEQGINFPRTVIEPECIDGALGFMTAIDPSKEILGYKAIAVLPQNTNHHLNPHQGIVTLLDYHTGKAKCILDGNYITAVRTAAVSASATHHLSRTDATSLALIGAGTQALEHLRAIMQIRPIKRVHVFSRKKSSYDSLCKAVEALSLYPSEITFHNSPQKAVIDADIIVTCTAAKTGLLSISDIPKGAHINAVGACRPGEIELNIHDHPNLKIYLDSQKSCFVESEEIITPLNKCTLSKHKIIGEIGSVFTGKISGRLEQEDITLFKSVGLAIEDLFAADYFYNQAIKINTGQTLT